MSERAQIEQLGTSAERVKEARIRAFLSKSELARQAGVSRRTVIRAETGDLISEIGQERISRILGFDRKILFGDNGAEPEPEEASA